jgi:large subunit ribosomal protein L3
MGARKRHSPRRGSLAYSPRIRAKSMEARIRAWPKLNSEEPKILAHCGFKAGCVQIVSIDDRDKTPNAGKQLVSLGTVLVTPPVLILGIRGYSKDHNGLHAEFDVYAEDIPKHIAKEISLKNNDKDAVDNAEKRLKKIKEIFAIVAVSPRSAGLEQKKPYIFEASVNGGDIPKQFAHVKEVLGKEIKIDQIFETGATVDVAAITKGKGWQGVIQRWGVKKKQHKSRKTVREVGSLGPISPQSVMYTVPRAGQMGFHQRTEYDKRIMVMGNTDDEKIKINPDGGYKHFGLVKGDFIILKGSVPGTYRRLIKLRSQIRNAPAKVNKPNILEVVI